MGVLDDKVVSGLAGGPENVSPEWAEVLARIVDTCQLKLNFNVPGYSVREIISPGTSLYDPNLGFVDDDGSLIVGDIGGQPERGGWDPERGHGAIWRLHRDDRLEEVVPSSNVGRGMVMFPKRAPRSFGKYAGNLFYYGQLRPGRPGAHHNHAVYWVPPGSRWPEPFVVIPDAGTIGGGVSGALMFSGWGAEGSPEEGSMFLHSFMNCTVYRVTPDRRVEPWLICDEEHAGTQVMPTRLYRAGAEWGDLAGELILTGRPGTSFRQPIAADVQCYRVVEENGQRRLVDAPNLDVQGDANRLLLPQVAPDEFGPLAGKRFFCRGGSVSGSNTETTMNRGEGELPYDADIVYVDDDGELRVFADDLQAGAPHLLFQGDRMVVATVRMSYSTGQFHYPDGSLYEIRYTG
ncbi:hypothetical protein [Rhodococcus koreensis]